MFMNKDQNLINEFAIKTLKENLNVMYAQIWREGQLTAEYKRMPVKTRLNTWSACKGVVSCAVGIALDEGLIQLDEKIVDIFPEYVPEKTEGYQTFSVFWKYAASSRWRTRVSWIQSSAVESFKCGLW